MPLRIAFDLDGVFADMEAELIRQAEIIFGEAMAHGLAEPPGSSEASLDTPSAAESQPATDQPTSGPPEGDSTRQAAAEASADNVPPVLQRAMTARQQRRLWQHVESIENFWGTLGEIEPGSLARLAAVAADRRWEVIFLTKRPETAGATAQVQSQRWLEAKGFSLPSVYVVQGSRGRIAAALGLDIVIDDRPENCLDVVVDSKARAVLVWRDEAKQVPAAARRLGIGVVTSVGECLDILAAVDPAEPRGPGVMARVRKLLGLKEPANV